MTLIDFGVDAILNLLSTIKPQYDSALILWIQPSAKLINININTSSMYINSYLVQSTLILSLFSACLPADSLEHETFKGVRFSYTVFSMKSV